MKSGRFSLIFWRTIYTSKVREFLATDPEVQVRFPALLDFLRSSGSGTGSTQPRESTTEELTE
jgi:hypothetical protein